jgi:mono/diheme cytochrome c family protein
MRSSVAGALFAALLAGCDSGTQDRDAVSSTRAVMRPNAPVPPGTVPRGGAAAAASLAAPGPVPTPALLARGEESFVAFCSPCHGTRGEGDGIVVSRGFPRPPSYHEPRLRMAAPEHIVGVITHGIGRMHPYAERIAPEDRWAIAHYVKALQSGTAPDAAGRTAP